MISDPWTHAARQIDAGRRPRPAFDRRAWSSVRVAAIVGATVLVLGIDHGGTGRGAWGWAALLLAAAAATVLAGRVRLGAIALCWLGSLSALTAWTALSSTWSAHASTALLEADRTLLYLGAGALVVVTAPRAQRWIPHATGLAATAICLDAVLLRVFPWFPGNSAFLGFGRLYQPVAYWNALGIVAAMGGLIALQIARSGDEPRAWRIGASASLPVTLPVMYLTFSRGAVIAFAAGLLASFLVSRNRIDWLVCAAVNALAPALVIAIAAHQQGLVSAYGDLTLAGDVLGVAVVLGLALAVPAALAIDVRPHRLRTLRLSRRASATACACLVALGAAGFVAAVGSPAAAWHRASAEFNREIWFKRDLQGNLNNRYGELSLSGRTGLWDGALRLGADHPLAGAGAGSFGEYWASTGRYPQSSREALSLYLETFAELGAIGVALLAGLVLLPLWAGARIGGTGSLVFGSFVAFALHAVQDMDWEWPVVTSIGIVCAALLVARAAPASRAVELSGRLRIAAGAVACALAVVSLAAAATGLG
jgi:hypothetical protein